ncbi:dUTP diphosphatase [Candidatus Uhrbacteria bacterium]|nr:dUTP diphosphatase [Candidatus Uhrbacteria bacterium]
MKLLVKRVDTGLPLPEYQTGGSVAFDLSARQDTVIQPGSVGRIPSNLIVRVPEGHFLLVASRSSTPTRKGLSVPHGIGVIDQDFSGPEDELLVQVRNFTDRPVTVSRGERIAQAMVVPVVRCGLEETDDAVTRETRGGFGSTG